MKISDSTLSLSLSLCEIDNLPSFECRSALGLYFSRIRGFFSLPRKRISRISRLHSEDIGVKGEEGDISRNISAVIPETDVSAVTHRANTVRTRFTSVNLFLFGARSQERYVKQQTGRIRLLYMISPDPVISPGRREQIDPRRAIFLSFRPNF